MGKLEYALNEDYNHIIKRISQKENLLNTIFMRLVDQGNFELKCGQVDDVYQFLVNKSDDKWPYRVMDFIQYVNESEITGVIQIDDDTLEHVKMICQNHDYNEACLRWYEPEVLIHSTPEHSWYEIKKDMTLKSWNTLKANGYKIKQNPIGMILKDPKEFSNYVMLGNGTTSEIVVSSSNKKIMDCNEESPYTPGARLYLDAKKLAADKLLIRDGGHVKIKDYLVLDKYLLFVATSEIVDPKEKNWTPKKFTDKADALYKIKA